jgi:hypothetical protein
MENLQAFCRVSHSIIDASINLIRPPRRGYRIVVVWKHALHGHATPEPAYLRFIPGASHIEFRSHNNVNQVFKILIRWF